MSIRVLFAAGGTGGHIFPAIAVYEELLLRYGSALQVHWLGSANRMESTMIPKYGIPYTAMPIQGFRSLMSLDTALLPFRVASSVMKARSCMRTFKPDVVVVTGAYISYPAGIAAKQLSIPYVVMESNVNIGKTNRQLIPHAAGVILSYEESQAQLPTHALARSHVLGNHVRSCVKQTITSGEAREMFGLHTDTPTLFAVGGSLGARSINLAMQGMLFELADETQAPFQIIWQTGKNFQAHVPDSLKGAVAALEFVDDVGAAYQAADVVIARSGATTLAELGVIGKPAILVPLPSASMGEQQLNANAAERRGAATVIADENLATELMMTVQNLMNNETQRRTMSQRMLAMGRPDAASKTVDVIEALVGGIR